MSRIPLLLTLACLLSALAGCGSGGTKTSVATPTAPALLSHTYIYSPALARVPACLHAGKARAWPHAFPSAFPVPPGTAITGQRVPLGGGHAASGYVPSKSFLQTVLFFRREVPRAGFRILDFESDAPHDSEGTYTGFGYIGRWQLKSLLTACKGAMFFQVSAVPSKAHK